MSDEIHGPRRRRRTAGRRPWPGRDSRRPLQELVAEPGSPAARRARRHRRSSTGRSDAASLAADQDRERVLEAERRRAASRPACGVALADRVEHARADRSRPADGRPRSARCRCTRRRRRCRRERSARSQMNVPPRFRRRSTCSAGLALDRLGEQLAEDDLLREVLRADARSRPAAIAARDGTAAATISTQRRYRRRPRATRAATGRRRRARQLPLEPAAGRRRRSARAARPAPRRRG